MTTAEGLVPQWDLPDRMGKSLRTANVGVQEIADYLDVHRNTVSGWLHGRIRPDVRTLRLWALRTGVLYDWLLCGDEAAPSDEQRPPGVGKRRRAQRPAGAPSRDRTYDLRIKRPIVAVVAA